MDEYSINSIDSLLNQDNTDVEFFTLNGHICKAKVESVYDGDTIICIFPYNNKLWKWHVRLNGLDTPEITLKSGITELEKQAGLCVKNFLTKIINNKIVTLHCGHFDKYGRLLADILINNNQNINELLINKKYAHTYHGQTKTTWFENELHFIIRDYEVQTEIENKRSSTSDSDSDFDW